MSSRRDQSADGISDDTSDEREWTDVITAYLWDGHCVLLALRSDSVSTYPNHWAGISGYLEGDDPLQWALVEIREECGVDRPHVTLRRAGATVDVDDPTIGRRFRVHPYLFSLDDPSQVRSDWEARRFEWVPVDELTERRRQPTVPRLYDAFEAVWPPWPTDLAIRANLDAAMKWLRDDREMGAGTLARAAASEVIKLVRLCEENYISDLRPKLAEAIERLRFVRPSMTPPANLLADISAALDQTVSASDLVEDIEHLVDKSERAETEVARRVALRIQSGWNVMTISYSSTVLRALQNAPHRIARVYVCEGRPLMEGRALATRLCESGINVTLLTDAQAFVRMRDVDAVLLGADSVRSTGEVVNKVGSAHLAFAARHFGKPVFVAAETLKFVRDESQTEFKQEENPPAEVWTDAPSGIDVGNVYFEAIPAELITAIVTEQDDGD